MKLPLKPAMTEGSLRYSGKDPDGLSEALSTPASTIRVKTTAKKTISYRCEFASAGSISFGLCTYDGDFRLTRETDSGKFLMFIPLSGEASFNASKETFGSRPGRGFITNGIPYGDMHIMGPRQHLIVIHDRNEMINRLSGLLETPVGGNLNFHPDIDLAAGPGRILQDLAEATFSGLAQDTVLRQSPLALSNLTGAITNLILETVPHRFSEALARIAPAPAPRHVRRAIDFMQANLMRPLSIADMAAVCNVSVRSLQKGFRDFKMTTPMAYLQHLRLEAAHRELQEATPGLTVAAIALKWGFTHFGRFAVDYRLRFGQLPSQTLRR
ncbi:AraC family transcriptional regulator [Agrobacterium rhizogenes]|uniref:AraC family transcriptional regulator n=2 Tax=Rhizobium rhizogenes TaxID=359 RepID=UPI0004D4F774|nr:AraC family transcriptional regulator [Rhizobium rhizogenes]KAA6483135.1 AraC family transcriptional regulator [Agrobacterium sp. ICMP 7243]OCJ02220.1 AraC family transcriptional regulator [Agrobacterium sp. 13-626]OCJ15669.1 AraC family transcriptional regulator [Agrobacterium sp. B133/95]KEA09318.1 AraC family transcriptional regulator [Rhizobium rhizogenes]MDJ1636660.1 AraC family transcriptional regulator [Rhizobium rhizogenes]